MKKIVILVLIGIILISNIVPKVNIGERFLFSIKNGDFYYAYIPSKGGELEQLNDRFAQFSDTLSKQETLYRRFDRNWWKFWYWGDYLFNPKWKYPYLKPDTVK